VGVDVADGNADNELGEITHGRQQMGSARFGGSSAGTPEVAVQYKHGSSNGPAEKDFAVATDALVGENAMGTFFDPIDNVLATAGPKEAHANTEECFVDPKVTANRAAVEDIEDETTQGRGYDDKQERSARLQALADDQATMMDAEVVVSCELLEGWVEFGDKGRAPSNAGR
jgi:hypothetical protein